MTDDFQCPNCSSINVVFSKKLQRQLCEDCGHVFDLKEPFVPYRIFISYGHDEHDALAIRLRDDLRLRGHEAWFDSERLITGDEWEASIERGLEWAAQGRPQAVVVLLLTPHSVRRPSGFCLNEVARALTLGLRIIPLMVVESEPPLSICRVQWLDMRMCIPIHEKDALYAPKFDRVLAAIERGELDFEGVQSRLLHVLQPIQFSADLLKLLRDFTGRQWVFDEVDRWFADPAGSKIFWLTGKPGVGKSSIAAWIRENRREVAAFHFCDINSEEKRNPAKLVCSIVYQLSTQLPEYEVRLARLGIEAIVNEYHESYTLFDKLLVQPLADAFPAPDRSVVVLIDALDEATVDRRNEIVMFLSRCADKTPAWLRFLVTSRPEPEIVSAFQRLSPYVLDTAREENLLDLQLYLQSQLPGITTEQTAEILRRSEGVFLYAAHVMDEVQSKTLSLARLEELPRGLKDVYQCFFQRQFGADLSYYEEKIAPLLQVIFAAREPLTLRHLKLLCGVTGDTELLRRLNRIGSLFSVSGENDEGTIRPFHRSLCEWISDRSSAGYFVISESDGHRVLAEHGMFEYRKGMHFLSTYSLRHLPAHLCAAARWDELVGDETRPGPLSDLRYIQAKCEAGLVHDLVLDYSIALTALPEFRNENEHNSRRDVAMVAYNKALREYSVVRYEWRLERERGEPHPEPIYPLLPPELQGETIAAIPDESSPRAARLRLFSNFTSSHITPLVEQSTDTLPLAWNSANGGPICMQAESLITGFKRPWLCRTPRPSSSALRPQCLRSFEGHSGWVESVSVSPDGRCVVSGSSDKTLRVWDLESGACLRTLKGHSAGVRSVSISLNGRHAVSGSDDTTVRLWDLESGVCLRTFEGHSAWVRSVSFSPDGRCAVSGSYDNTLRVWDLESGVCLRTLKGHRAWVRCVSVSPEGRRAVSGSSDNTLRVWDLASGACLRTLAGHIDVVSSVSISPDGRCVVSGSSDKTLRVWDLESGACLQTLKGHNAEVWSVSVSPDGRYVVSGSDDKSLRVWDLESGVCLRTLEDHSAEIWSVSISSDGRHAVSGSYDAALRVWDLKDGACLCALEGHKVGVRSVSVSPNSQHAVSGSEDKTLWVWNLDTGQCLSTLEGHNDVVSSVSISPDGRRAVSGSSDKTLRVWDLESGACLRTLKGHSAGVRSVSISPNGRHAVSGSDDTAVRVWDLENGACLRTFKGHSVGVSSVSISPDGLRVLSGSFDNTLRVWDLDSGACLLTLEGHSAWVRSVSVSPDGRYAVSGSYDNTLRVWDLRSGACLRMLKGHSAWVRSVSFGPDGRCAVSGSSDMTLRLWDIKSGECIAVYNAGASVIAVAFSPEGNRIVCGTDDGQMHFLTPVNLQPSGPPIITPTYLWVFGEICHQTDGSAALSQWEDRLTCRCTHCGKLFATPAGILECGFLNGELMRNGLFIPDFAYDDPRLLAPCPHCGKHLKFNPFVVDGSMGKERTV